LDTDVPSGFGVEDKTAVDPYVLSDSYIETSWGSQMAGIVQPAEGYACDPADDLASCDCGAGDHLLLIETGVL
jgi:hypothetical protein